MRLQDDREIKYQNMTGIRKILTNTPKMSSNDPHEGKASRPTNVAYYQASYIDPSATVQSR